MCHIHLCCHGDVVHLLTVPLLVWPVIEAGWCNWAETFVDLAIYCLFHGHCFLEAITCHTETFTLSAQSSVSIHKCLPRTSLSVIVLALSFQVPEQQARLSATAPELVYSNVGPLLLPHKADDWLYHWKFYPAGGVFKSPLSFKSIPESTCACQVCTLVNWLRLFVPPSSGCMGHPI